MPNIPLAYVSVYRRMSDIFHTLTYACTIRNSVTGPLGRLYVIYNFVTFGDTSSPKWVTTYNLNYTVDGINWKLVWNHAVIAIYISFKLIDSMIYFVMGRKRFNLKNIVIFLYYIIVFRSRETKMLTMMQPYKIFLEALQQELYALFH